MLLAGIPIERVSNPAGALIGEGDASRPGRSPPSPIAANVARVWKDDSIAEAEALRSNTGLNDGTKPANVRGPIRDMGLVGG